MRFLAMESPGNGVTPEHRLVCNAVLLLHIPILLVLVQALAGIPPVEYPLGLGVYYTAALVLRRLLGRRSAVIGAGALALVMALLSLFSLTTRPDTAGWEQFAMFKVDAGEAVEQDIHLDPGASGLRRLLKDPDVWALLRVNGSLDPEKVRLAVDGRDLGSLKSLFWDKPFSFYYPDAPSYLMQIDKSLLAEHEKLTLRFSSASPFEITYGSGLFPLPPGPHSRLIRADGTVVDLPASRPHRRFRFQAVIYLLKLRSAGTAASPVILGTIQ